MNPQNKPCCEKCIDRKRAIKLLGNEDAFWSRTKGITSGCIEWQSTLDNKGYGVLTLNGRQWKAHRIAKALSGEFVPHFLASDHLCKNTKCVNSEHIELVMNAENVMRGKSFAVENANKTECLNGHPFSKYGGIRNYRGKIWRFCKECKKLQKRIYYARNRKTN